MNILEAVKQYKLSCIRCSVCGKRVSTLFIALPTDTPDKDLLVRAFIQCPECIEKNTPEKDLDKMLREDY